MDRQTINFNLLFNIEGINKYINKIKLRTFHTLKFELHSIRSLESLINFKTIYKVVCSDI